MLFALLAAFPRPNAGALPQGGSARGKACCRRHHWSGGASHAARELGAGEDVVAAYQARAAVRQKLLSLPRGARVPEGEASAGSEPALGKVPPLTAAGTADAAREPQRHRPRQPHQSRQPGQPPSRCQTRAAQPAARHRRTGCGGGAARGDGGIPDRQDLHLPRALALLVFIAGPPTTAPSIAGRNAIMSEGEWGETARLRFAPECPECPEGALASFSKCPEGALASFSKCPECPEGPQAFISKPQCLLFIAHD